MKSLAQPHIEKSKSIISTIDARRNEVYAAEFDHSLNFIKGDHCLIIEENVYPEDWPDPENLIVCGNGANKIGELLAAYPIECIDSKCDAANQSQLAFHKFNNGLIEDINYLKPNYLKPPNITQSKKKLF